MEPKTKIMQIFIKVITFERVIEKCTWLAMLVNNFLVSASKYD